MRLVSLKSLPILFIFCCLQWLSAQYVIPKKPAILYPVYDEVGLLSEYEKTSLNQKLIHYEKETSTEIEVIIIRSTQGEDINFLATQFGEKWQIGKKEVDNGVVFLIATEDRTMSIQQGRSVEQYLTASTTGQILDYLVAPNFKKGKFHTGIDQGTNAIMEALQGKYQPKKQENDDILSKFIVIFLVIVFVIILAYLFPPSYGDDDDDDDIILSRRGRTIFFPTSFGSGRSGGFGGGGSFGGFGGGGSFGGGGASGGW